VEIRDSSADHRLKISLLLQLFGVGKIQIRDGVGDPASQPSSSSFKYFLFTLDLLNAA
jgi:hypothetical protein